jgi:hypothetical protein
MSLYNETTVTKTTEITAFDRAYRIEVLNPNAGPKAIRYDEETIERVTQDGVTKDTSKGPIGHLTKQFTPENANTPFNLLNPVTGEALGSTATYADLQVLLYSLYFHLATERDNA